MTTPTIIPERLAKLEHVKLISGHGSTPPNGKPVGCVMDLVSYIAGEPWTDHPKCASPVLTAFCIRLNDHWNDTDRQLLIPFIPRLVGTAADKETESRRAYMAVDWSVRVLAPKWLRKIGLGDHAAKLEQLDALTSAKLARQALPIITAAKDAAWKKRNEARNRLYAAGAAEAAGAARAAGAAWAAWAAGAAGAAGAAEAAEAAGAAGAAEAAEAKGATYQEMKAAARKAIDAALADTLRESRDEALVLLDAMIEIKVEAVAA